MKNVFCLLITLVCALVLRAADAPITPLTNVHAHNDYEHTHPLFDALDQGFCSVEADIHLVDGKLLVAHDRRSVKPDRTLQSLYLDPLQTRGRANGGHVFRDGPEFFLLIDFKTAPGPTWEVLRGVLKNYADMLTEFRDDSVQRKAVTVILTGDSPREQVAAEPVRLAAVDGRLPDLKTNPNPHLVPWISEDWWSDFKWGGNGAMPADQMTKLREIVAKAHAQGRKVRFWGGPDIPALWRVQLDAGVDFINTDRLADLRRFLLAHGEAK